MTDLADTPHYLLTGAGFSNAVNVYLTMQIWEHTFNQPEVTGNEALRKEMLNNAHDLNYEIIYEVLRKTYPKLFPDYLAALDRVFAQIDGIVRISVVGENKSHRVNLGGLRTWLSGFREKAGKKGFIFTLNHDLFLERLYGAQDGAPYMPGIPEAAHAKSVSKTGALQKIAIPKEATLDQVKKDLREFNLLKLHGSSNWTYADGSTTMLTGPRKDQTVKDHPLLDAYGSIFAEALQTGAGQLWVIGYGFADKNINDAIVRGVENGLSVYIVDIALPKEFLGGISGRCRQVREAVRGYIRNSLAGIFPVGEVGSIPFEEIKTLMGRK